MRFLIVATSKCSDPWNSSTSSPTIKLTQKNRKNTKTILTSFGPLFVSSDNECRSTCARMIVLLVDTCIFACGHMMTYWCTHALFLWTHVITRVPWCRDYVKPHLQSNSDTDDTDPDADVGGLGKYSHGKFCLPHQHHVEQVISAGGFNVHDTEASEAVHKLCMRLPAQRVKHGRPDTTRPDLTEET